MATTKRDARLDTLRREIVKMKHRGQRTVDMVDMYKATHIPLTTISRLVQKLEREGFLVPYDN